MSRISSTILIVQAPHRQRGAVLAVGLIILLILTVIGAAALHRVSLEEKMAANAMYQSSALSASESAATNAVASSNNLSGAMGGANTVTIAMGSYLNSTAVIRFRQITLAPNNTVTLGKGRNAVHFDIEATGRMDAGNARVTTYEGVYQLAPAK